MILILGIVSQGKNNKKNKILKHVSVEGVGTATPNVSSVGFRYRGWQSLSFDRKEKTRANSWMREMYCIHLGADVAPLRKYTWGLKINSGTVAIQTVIIPWGFDSLNGRSDRTLWWIGITHRVVQKSAFSLGKINMAVNTNGCACSLQCNFIIGQKNSPLFGPLLRNYLSLLRTGIPARQWLLQYCITKVNDILAGSCRRVILMI